MRSEDRDRIIPREEAVAAAAEIYLEAKIRVEVQRAIADLRRGPVLTTKQAADYCGLKPQTMRALKHERKGPVAYKLGRLTVYYPADLDAWLASKLTRVDAPGSAATDSEGETESPNQEGQRS